MMTFLKCKFHRELEKKRLLYKMHIHILIITSISRFGVEF